MSRLLSLLFAVPYISMWAQAPKVSLEKTQTIYTPKSGAFYVFESPKGDAICFSDGKMNSVYIKKIAGPSEPVLAYTGNACGYFPAWTVDGKNILMKNKTKKEGNYTTETVAYNVQTKRAVTKPEVLYSSIPSYALGTTSSDPIIYIDKQLRLVKNTRLQTESIVIENKECYQPILSPDKKSVAVHIGSAVWVYDISNQKQPVCLGNMLVTSWSPDSRYLLGHMDESKDGHDISNSDLFIIDVKNKQTIKLTNTTDKYEMNPSWSADGKKIYYVDVKAGSILVSTIKIAKNEK